MKTRRLEEILDECLSAYLEDGRSVEESLRLHSAYRGQLEPLLRTALELSGTFQSYSPPDHIQERGLARFLSDARARKNLRTLTHERKPGFFGSLFGSQRRFGTSGGAIVQQRIGMAAVAAGVAVVAIAVSLAAFDSGSNGSRDDQFVVPPPTAPATATPTAAPETPEVVRSVQQSVINIREKLQRGEKPNSSEIIGLTQAVQGLGGATGIDDARVVVETTIRDADAVLKEVVGSDPAAAEDPTVKEAVVVTRGVAGGFGIDLDETPTDTPADTPTAPPAATPTAPPTDGPTPTRAPTAPPTDTPAPTAEPTPLETPTTRGVGL